MIHEQERTVTETVIGEASGLAKKVAKWTISGRERMKKIHFCKRFYHPGTLVMLNIAREEDFLVNSWSERKIKKLVECCEVCQFSKSSQERSKSLSTLFETPKE
jgi:hypothetical protein